MPVYRVSVEIPDAARMTNNNEMRIGGHRVGVVESIDAVQTDEELTTFDPDDEKAGRGAQGGVVARLNLKLDKSVGPLPKDSIFRVRYRSSFGLKYLEIIRGEGEGAPEGFTFNGLDDAPRRAATPTAPPSATCPATRSSPATRRLRTAASSRRPSSTTSPTPSTAKTRENGRKNLVGFGNAFAGRGTSLNDAISTPRAPVRRPASR